MTSHNQGAEPIAQTELAPASTEALTMAQPEIEGMASDRSLEAMLVEADVIAPEQIKLARNIAHAEGCRIGPVLIRTGMISPWELAALQALYLGISMVDLASQEIDAEALSYLPEEVARRYTAMPLRLDGDELVVAMADPEDMGAIQDLAAQTRRPIKPVVATSAEIEEHIDIHYKVTGSIQAKGSVLPAEGVEGVSRQTVMEEPVVRLVDLLIRQAIQDRASDIHIEPQESRLRIRFRIDGVLHEVTTLPLSMHPPLISRLKIMSGMNIAERRRSQDGQFTTEVDDRKVDVRVASSHTVLGEMIDLRLLDKSFAIIDLGRLGMLPRALEQYEGLLKLPYGMILVSGPTGAGKTTTLYASLHRINRQERHVVTIEDPVEYRFADINQIQINVQAGITFATQLRAVLRIDPDVILVGEIRDQETAIIAIQSAMTGHLVLSTIHANDAVSALYRLRELGVEPYLVASAVAGVTAQRMVRRLCPSCQTMTKRPAAEQAAYTDELGEQREQFLYGAGCNVCARTGYHGRTGVFETLPITEPIREMFLANASWGELRNKAVDEGMMTMRRDGMTKVREGITTPYEVMRAVFTL